MTRRSMMGLVRKGKHRVRGSGFLVTWDVDSKDRPSENRLHYFLFGRRVCANGRNREYPGFVFKEGVRYVAQSAVFVLPHRLEEICTVLVRNGIDHEVDENAFP